MGLLGCSILWLLALTVWDAAAAKRSKRIPLAAPHAKDCCQYVDEDSATLFSCIMEAGATNEMALVQKFSKEDRNPEKRKYRFGIVTYATNNIWDYTAYTAAVNEVFAEHNGHLFHLFDDTVERYLEPDSRWSKVKILEDAVDPISEWAEGLDYIVWVDADLIFLDLLMNLDTLVRSTGEHVDIIVSAEHTGGSTLINSGTVIAKRSAWSHQFMQQWWTHKNRNLFSDQESFDMVYKLMDVSEQKKHIAVLAPDVINSDPPAMEKLQPHNQVLHLMGEHAPFRIKVFKTAFSNICTSLSNPVVRLPKQLGVNRSNLLKWNIEVYRTEMMELLEVYEPRAELGLNTLHDSKKLSNSVHHYCHGVKTRNTGNDVETANTLRNMSFQLVYKNFNNRRAINAEYAQNHNKLMEPDWPEHLKTVATMCGHVVGFGTLEQRKSTVQLQTELLLELHSLAHIGQKGAIELMMASVEHSFALIEIEGQNFRGALVHIRKQLEMLEKLSTVNGDHILIGPLEAEGNILSQLQKYKEAGTSYKRAMDIVSNLYGSEHVGLATLLMNCGISYYMYSQKFLQKSWPEDKKVKAVKRAKELLLTGDDMLNKGKKLLSNYDSAQGRQHLSHLLDFSDRIEKSLRSVEHKLELSSEL